VSGGRNRTGERLVRREAQKQNARGNARRFFYLNFLRQSVYTRSVPAFPVSERKARALRERLDALRCSERDLEETFFRRSGVDLRHRPTGVRIRCSEQSCQALNRFLARRMLADELEARLQKKTRHEVKAERIRKAKGKLKRPSVTECLDQFTLRPFPSAGRPSVPKELGKLLFRLENPGTEETS
jgi:peptide chain release factor